MLLFYDVCWYQSKSNWLVRAAEWYRAGRHMTVEMFSFASHTLRDFQLIQTGL